MVDGDERDSSQVRSKVREHYGRLARPAAGSSSCCCSNGSSGSPSSCDCGTGSSQVSSMYETPAVADLPEDVTGLSLGCGDPVSLAELQPGQTVLDLGSGGGIDCFLAAQRVGESGHVIGVDMTAEMMERARANRVKMGANNVEFRLGEIEHLPVADNSVDVIISNCVVNLSPDKPQVFRDAFRVLRPGGHLAITDIMTDGPLPEEVRKSLSAWAGCIGGALDVRDYVAALEAAGFRDVRVSRQELDQSQIEAGLAVLGLDGKATHVRAMSASALPDVFSGRVTARKP